MFEFVESDLYFVQDENNVINPPLLQVGSGSVEKCTGSGSVERSTGAGSVEESTGSGSSSLLTTMNKRILAYMILAIQSYLTLLQIVSSSRSRTLDGLTLDSWRSWRGQTGCRSGRQIVSSFWSWTLDGLTLDSWRSWRGRTGCRSRREWRRRCWRARGTDSTFVS